MENIPNEVFQFYRLLVEIAKSSYGKECFAKMIHAQTDPEMIWNLTRIYLCARKKCHLVRHHPDYTCTLLAEKINAFRILNITLPEISQNIIDFLNYYEEVTERPLEEFISYLEFYQL